MFRGECEAPLNLPENMSPWEIPMISHYFTKQ